jgi:hypothetical protein
MKRTVAVLGLLAALGVSEASASTKSFNFICAVNYALRACVSVQVTTTPNISGGTDVVIKVTNHQGGVPDQTGGSLITVVGLTAPPKATLGTPSGLSVTSQGAQTVGNPGASWGISNAGINGQIEFAASTPSLGGNPNGGILGCDPSELSPTAYFRTCGGGAVAFNFHTTGLWDASLAEVGIKFDGVVGVATRVECRTEVSASDPAYCPNVGVTPEPVSMALLATGLLGLGGAGLRRRRKGTDVENG